MSLPAYPFTVTPEISEGKKWQGIQQWLQQACNNAGIGYSASGYLTPIDPTDSEGVKWAKLGAWMTLLANNVSSGGGGSGGLGGIAVATTAVSSTLAKNTLTTVTAAGATNQALPSSPGTGWQVMVKNLGAGTVAITSGSANIFGASAVSSYTLGGQGSAATFTFDGTYWNVT